MNKVSYFVVTGFPDGSLRADGRKYYAPYGAGSIENCRHYKANNIVRDAIRGKGFWGNPSENKSLSDCLE